MRALRPATLLTRLGLAGAGLVATVIAFAAAGGLVAFGLWPEQGRQTDEQRLVLPGAVAHAVRGQQPSSGAGNRPIAPRARTVAAPAGSLNDVALPSPEITVPEQPEPVTRGPHVPVRPEPEQRPPVVAEPARPLEPVAETVGETTSALATSLRDAAAALARGLAAISPAAAPAVTQAGTALAGTVDETGRALRDVLGGPGPGD